MNRRAFLAGLLAATARCSFGLSLPKVEGSFAGGTFFGAHEVYVYPEECKWEFTEEVCKRLEGGSLSCE